MNTINAILAHLSTEGIPHSLDDTGGGCLCVRVDLTDDAWIWVSDDAGNLVTCRYDDLDDDTGECLAYGGSLTDMTRTIREHLPTPHEISARGLPERKERPITTVWLSPEITGPEQAMFVRVLCESGIAVPVNRRDETTVDVYASTHGGYNADFGDVATGLDGTPEEAAYELVRVLTGEPDPEPVQAAPSHLERVEAELAHTRREIERLRYQIADMSKRLAAAECEAAQADELLSAIEDE